MFLSQPLLAPVPSLVVCLANKMHEDRFLKDSLVSGLRARGSPDRLLGNSQGSRLSVLYGSYYVSHGDNDSSQASDWSGLRAADSCEEKHTWV